jgi:uncharacterized protein (TIGR03545 family)
MKKWIRWKGAIAFLAVMTIIVLAWIFLVDGIVRRSIESAGTRAVGARVDVADADLSLFPMGLTIQGLAVTNPDAPMKNTVEIDRIRFDLDTAFLIKRKVVINDMSVEGLQINTDRKRSGAIEQKKKKKPETPEDKAPKPTGRSKKTLCGEFSMPSFSQPDVNAILSKEPLKSIAMANDLEAKLKKEKTRWQNQLKELPDEKKLNDYGKRLDQLKKGGGSLGALLGSAKDLTELQSDIQKDLDALKKAQSNFDKGIKGYERQVRKLARAPEKDIRRLVNKYSLSTDGLANLSQLLFGEKLCGWIGSVWQWYAKLKPYLSKVPKGKDDGEDTQSPSRGKGIDVRFAEIPPMPDFLIRRMKVNANLTQGDFTGNAENITSDQTILGNPMTYRFSGKEMAQATSLALNGTANYIQPNAPKNTARLKAKGVVVQELSLIRDASFPLNLHQATSDVDLDFALMGNDLKAMVKADFRRVDFQTAPGKDQTGVAKAMTSALGKVKGFALAADITGTPRDYAVDISSDLDQVLRSAVGDLVKTEAAKLKSELQKQIAARVKDPIAQAQSGMTGLNGIEKELSKRLGIGNNLLKNVKLSL